MSRTSNANPQTLTELMARRVAVGGIALIDRDKPVSAGALDEESRRVAQGLHRAVTHRRSKTPGNGVGVEQQDLQLAFPLSFRAQYSPTKSTPKLWCGSVSTSVNPACL